MQNLNEIVPGSVIRQSKLYQLQNNEGLYYAVDPGMTEFGCFAKEFYPRSDIRRPSGYIDSERYFLNAILKHKRTKGVGRKELFHNASSEDVAAVLVLLESKIARMQKLNPSVAEHIKCHILPLVGAYAKALESAGFPAKYFFDKNFTIDTGEICNLGGAYYEYRALTTRKNSIVTPQHDRVYSSSGSLATEGKVWVIGVAPMSVTFRNGGIPPSFPALYIEEQDMAKRSSVEGYALRRWYIPLKEGDVEILNASHHKNSYLIPGRSV